MEEIIKLLDSGDDENIRLAAILLKSELGQSKRIDSIKHEGVNYLIDIGYRAVEIRLRSKTTNTNILKRTVVF